MTARVAMVTAAAHRCGKPSAALVLDEVHRTLGAVHTLIHIDADSIIGPDGSLDATTVAVMPDLVESRGTVVFFFDEPREPMPRAAPGVSVIGLSVRGKCSSPQICGGIMRLLGEGVAGAYTLSSGGSLKCVMDNSNERFDMRQSDV